MSRALHKDFGEHLAAPPQGLAEPHSWRGSSGHLTGKSHQHSSMPKTRASVPREKIPQQKPCHKHLCSCLGRVKWAYNWPLPENNAGAAVLRIVQYRRSSGCIPQGAPIQAVLFLCVHQLGLQWATSRPPRSPRVTLSALRSVSPGLCLEEI